MFIIQVERRDHKLMAAIGAQYALDDFQCDPEEMTRFYEDDFSTADSAI